MSVFFHVFKVAQNGTPVFVEAAQSLDAAFCSANALRETVPGEYLYRESGNGQTDTIHIKR